MKDTLGSRDDMVLFDDHTTRHQRMGTEPEWVEALKVVMMFFFFYVMAWIIL